MAKMGKDKLIMGIIGAIAAAWILIMLIGVISMCGSCISTGPASDDSQLNVQPAFNYSHPAAKNITVTGTFTEHSLNDVRVYESASGLVEIVFWGTQTAPNVTFSEAGDTLAADILLDTLSDGVAAYLFLPAGSDYNVTLRNLNGSVAVLHEAGLNGSSLDIEAAGGEIVLIHNGFDRVRLDGTGQIYAIFSGGDARYLSSKGNVSLGITGSEGSVSAEAPEGGIDAVILPGAKFTLNATSSTGTASCTIPLNYTLQEKSRLAGSNGQGASVDLSSRGDITVEELHTQ